MSRNENPFALDVVYVSSAPGAWQELHGSHIWHFRAGGGKSISCTSVAVWETV